MTGAAKVTVEQSGAGESLSIPAFGYVYKLYSRSHSWHVASYGCHSSECINGTWCR